MSHIQLNLFGEYSSLDEVWSLVSAKFLIELQRRFDYDTGRQRDLLIELSSYPLVCSFIHGQELAKDVPLIPAVYIAVILYPQPYVVYIGQSKCLAKRFDYQEDAEGAKTRHPYLSNLDKTGIVHSDFYSSEEVKYFNRYFDELQIFYFPSSKKVSLDLKVVEMALIRKYSPIYNATHNPFRNKNKKREQVIELIRKKYPFYAKELLKKIGDLSREELAKIPYEQLAELKVGFLFKIWEQVLNSP